jgi:putative transposase
MKKALKRHGRPETIVTDGLKSYPSAMRELGNLHRRAMDRHITNRAEKRTPSPTPKRARDAALPKDCSESARLYSARKAVRAGSNRLA